MKSEVYSNHLRTAINIQRLREISITGKSAEMRQRMLDEEFIFEDIALLGQ